jgi:hypothetical protein
VISEAVALRAGIDFGAAPRHEIEIRGRDERLVVRTFTNAVDLPMTRDVSFGSGTARRPVSAARPFS